ncbi:hypothetical protein [Rhizobium sp. MHM7A]|uniref:hypothetical protein n=1 Tax=Rhizobium sp. MHM7A TaxID=2583233 RepID=UPI001106228C|nr:hypothetical protein [Rhizobium sp. MHM7A]TLX15810.1 hypothetical protein FFR93_00405 [Rhizobium sp. MHM7A]
MPTRSAVILNNLFNAFLYFGGNFAVCLLLSLPVKWAVAEACDSSLLCIAFATLSVLAGTCFQQRGSWSEILIIAAVAGCLAFKFLGDAPLVTLSFPFFFLAAASIVGVFLMVFGKLERPKLWHA